ncbi:N-acetylglucosamine kinase-like BadF-type ATPase [Microbacterium natoriense]|uniref:N-acetylglucosamine kinase-like BadF-type ATPase n=1 Tax=Microbacterium natoriense TaxID=284570 RepID=A0AAW8EWC9_9MICO|nr:BadF/BadG/BcrA/BcrD ATPase family protein [Microbacterium natoriense]MDQ0647833.1 N-acetylglucosamine kinase-like BadF-type ATPase [Microbacterium natoriense]
MTCESDLILAVDGGGSKTDVVLLDTDGAVLAWERGHGSSPQLEGLDESVRIIDALVDLVLDGRDTRRLAHVGLYLSGLDLPDEIDAFRSAIEHLPWARGPHVAENDLHALLRAGTDAADAVAVICGTGMNAIGVRSDGAVVRFPALGPLSGDWGGGSELGDAVVWHSARAEDGRGPSTSLHAMLLDAVGAPSVSALIEDVHLGRRDDGFARLAPLIFDAALAGDAVARGVVQRQGDEVVSYVAACIARLGLQDQDVPVVFGGGVARGRDPLLLESIAIGLAERAPRANLEIVDAPPVLGAALLALGDGGADAAALARAAASLSTDERFSQRLTASVR